MHMNKQNGCCNALLNRIRALEHELNDANSLMLDLREAAISIVELTDAIGEDNVGSPEVEAGHCGRDCEECI